MDFVHRMITMVQGWGEPSPSPETSFVDEQSERLVQLVMAGAADARDTARAAKLRKIEESRVIGAVIEKLHDAGF